MNLERDLRGVGWLDAAPVAIYGQAGTDPARIGARDLRNTATGSNVWVPLGEKICYM